MAFASDKNNSMIQPKKWLLVLLALINPSIGFLYIGRAKWALFYFILPLLALFFDGNAKLALIVGVAIYLIAMIHCIYQGFTNQIHNWSRYHIGLKILFGFIFIWVFVRLVLINFYNVPATSMAPNFPEKSYVLMKRWGVGFFNSYLGVKYDIQHLK